MAVDIDALNSSVFEIVSDFEDEYEATESVDYATRCANLKEGSTVPKKGGIKLTGNEQHIQEYAFGASEKIRELCDKQRSGILSSMSTAPSEEALRMMQAISLREKGVTKTELDALISKYGKCYQVRRFISDQMRKRELGLPLEDECDATLKQIDYAEQAGLESIRLSKIAGSKLSKAARLAKLKQQLNHEGLFAMEPYGL